jgi:hypothetical protein
VCFGVQGCDCVQGFVGFGVQGCGCVQGLWVLGLGFRVQGSGLRHLALLLRVCRVKLFDHAFKIVRGQPDTVLKK